MEADKSNICNRQAGDPGEPAYRISSSLNPRLKAEDVGQRERIPPSSACCVLFRSTAHLGEDNLLNSVYHSTVHLIQKHANRHIQKQYSPRYLGALCPSQHDIKLSAYCFSVVYAQAVLTLEAEGRNTFPGTAAPDKATLLVGVPLALKPGSIWTAWSVWAALLFNIILCCPLKWVHY